MEFKNESQKETFGKVSRWLQEIFGEFALQREGAPVIQVTKGSTFANVAVFPWGDSEAIVRTSAIVVKGAVMSPELMKFLLLANWEAIYGGFCIDDDGDIWFNHTIYGSTMDKEELKSSIMAVPVLCRKVRRRDCLEVGRNASVGRVIVRLEFWTARRRLRRR